MRFCTKSPASYLLFLWKSAIETIDEDVRINESGHEYKDPLSASPGRETPGSDVALGADAGVRSPDRTNGASILDLREPDLCRAE